MHRSHVEDRARAAFVHARKHRLRGQERPVEMDRNHLAPFVIAEFFDSLDHLDPGVRQKNVYPPVRLDHRCDAALHGALIGHIHVDAHVPVAKRLRRLSCRIDVDIGDDHGAARRCEGLGDFKPDAARAAGDEADLVLEVHWYTPACRLRSSSAELNISCRDGMDAGQASGLGASRNLAIRSATSSGFSSMIQCAAPVIHSRRAPGMVCASRCA